MAMVKSGKYVAEKIKYLDGIGCCFWIPFEEDPDCGICFDFNYADIDDLIALFQMLKETEAEEFKDD